MITRLFLPLPASQFANSAQVLIPLEALCFGIPMLPDPCILARRNQNIYLRRVRVKDVIHPAFVIGTVGRKIQNRLFNLFQQTFHSLVIADAIFGEEDRLDFAVVRVGADMQLTSGAPLGGTVHAHFPLPFAINLQARAIHDDIQALAVLLRQAHLQIFTALG